MIQLIRMNEIEYLAYLEKAVSEYAAEKIQAGNWTEAEALERSRKDFERLLPQGHHTPSNFVNKLVSDNGETVGYLWYCILDNAVTKGFIYDFEIYPQYRRRGYASQALAALENEAKEIGVKKLELHVFGFNIAARELYKKSGFIETNVNMAKEI